MIARLRPGVSLAAAQSALDAAAKHVDETEHPYTGPHGEDAGYRVKVISLRDQLLGDYRTVTLILLGAVAAVLLIACVNVANLLLVRAVAREKETTVRRALGATEARLIAQWITESAVLALLGGALGSHRRHLGREASRPLERIRAPRRPRRRWPSAALHSGRLLDRLRAVRSRSGHIASTKMTWGQRGTTRRSRRAAFSLVTVEVALAVMLMIGAGLLFKSFYRLRHVDPGFNPVHLLTMQVQFPPTRPFSIVRVTAFYTELREKLARLPGVISATQGNLPRPRRRRQRRRRRSLHDQRPPLRFQRTRTASSPTSPASLPIISAPSKFPLRTGRLFTPADYTNPPPAVIVNETLARAFFPQGAIGQEIGLPKLCRDSSCGFDWSTIVGVAADVKTASLDRAPIPQIYMPFPGGSSVVLRTTGDPMSPGARSRAPWFARSTPICPSST